jgi:hypothetical protein
LSRGCTSAGFACSTEPSTDTEQPHNRKMQFKAFFGR